MPSLKNNSSLFILVIVLSVFALLHPAVYAQVTEVSGDAIDFLTKTGEAMAEIAEAVKPSVVNISTTRTIKERPFNPFFEDPFLRRFFGDRFGQPGIPRERKTTSLGSGVIVSPDGYILTNNHVIKDAEEIKVILPDRREFKGRIIGTDPKTDLAVIKIDAEDLPTITWGDSDKLKVGEIVLAIGSPYGLTQTVTMGIVSAVGRANVGIAEYEDFIQTDAAINPGNSGGALVNTRGELVGINTAIFTITGGYQGIGFAIPSNMAQIVMDSLIKKGKVVRGWLGVSIQPITPELAQQFHLEEEYGALVADVIEDSPAEKAGIKRGDVIIEFKGKKIEGPYTLRNIVAGTPPGEVVELKVVRDGEVKSLMVTIGELSAELPERGGPMVYKNALRGVRVQNLTPDLFQQLDLPKKIRGVVVTHIEAGSPAETKLIPGDVILEINRKAIANVEDYEAIVSKIKPDESILLLIFRRGSSIFITIRED